MRIFGPSKEKREKQEQETAVLRSQLKRKREPKKHPHEVHKAYLDRVAANVYKGFKPQEYGIKLWWVLGLDKKGKKHCDGPYFSYSEADKKRATWDEGDIFELRNITNKRDAEKEIDRILKERLEEEQESLQGRLSSIGTPKRTLPEVAEPPKRHRFGFGRNGKKPRGVSK